MQLFLLWRPGADEGRHSSATLVARKIETFYQGLFKDRLQSTVLCQGGVNLVYLELPVHGWKRPFLERERGGWALSIDYPIDAEAALADLGDPLLPGEPLLPKVGRTLLRRPRDLLRRLSPPMTLIWREAMDEETVYLQNDGLGFSQLLEYEDARQWAISNRVLAFRALGVGLEMVREEWAAKCALGWMPGDSTGFRQVSFLKPATQLRISRQGVTRMDVSVINDWIHPAPKTPSEATEIATESLRDYLRSAEQCWDSAHAGLTGGFDTRTLAAAMLASGTKGYYFRTRGFARSHDALIARKMAMVAGVPHVVVPARSPPPANQDTLRKSIEGALKWQGSLTEHHSLKTRLSEKSLFDGGDVNIMGQHGENAGAVYLDRLTASKDPTETPDVWLKNHMLRNRGGLLQPQIRKQVEEIFMQAYGAADRHGLTGFRGLDFFYLYERTRRWASGGIFMQTGKVIAPFLNPRMIMAAYSLQPEERLHRALHRHILQKCYPQWSHLPYTPELNAEQAEQLLAECAALDQPGGVFRVAAANAMGSGNGAPSYAMRGSLLYDNNEYWRTAGHSLLMENMNSEGMWTEIFAPTARTVPWRLGDDLAVLRYMQQLCEESWSWQPALTNNS